MYIKDNSRRQRSEGDTIVTTSQNDLDDQLRYSVFNMTDTGHDDEDIEDIDNIPGLTGHESSDFDDTESNHNEGRLKDDEVVQEISALDLMMNDDEILSGIESTLNDDNIEQDEFVVHGDDEPGQSVNDDSVVTPYIDDMDNIDDEIDNIVSPQLDHEENDNIS